MVVVEGSAGCVLAVLLRDSIARSAKLIVVISAFQDAQIGHGCGEVRVEKCKAEAKDVMIRFLERENARLRR